MFKFFLKKKEHDVATAYIYSPDFNKILLVKKRIGGRLMPPGGHISDNESFLQAVLRETMEETGIDISLLQTRRFGAKYAYLNEYCNILDPQQDEEFIVIEEISPWHFHIDHIFCFQYPVTFVSKNLNTIEASKVLWINVSDIQEKEFYPNVYHTIMYFYSKGIYEQKNKV